ncbi:TnsD family transposase [Bacillus sp. JJ1773]|uniref:TnsD family transposase n=1 Tax=Bacillus sp. JJ1773 TaxID=3122965 RepID=UPI002FFEB1C7
MIFFPFLYDDELLYSIIARYHDISGNENPKITMEELFDSSHVCASTILPAHLNALSQKLAVLKTFTPDYFIANHTLLPLYAPFIPAYRFQQLRTMMFHSNGMSIYMKLGKPSSTIKNPTTLRFCRECVTEEQVRNGEAFWHRSHQIEEVMLCPIHHTWLVESNIPYSERRNKHELITLEQYLMNEKFETYIISDQKREQIVHVYLKFIAQQIRDLLSNNFPPIGLGNLKTFYVKKLQQKGLATVSGRIRWRELIPSFNQYYGGELLNEINCYVNLEMRDTWLHKLLRKPRVSCHPIRHILLLGYLGETVSSMVGQYQKVSYEHFGKGPWPCLNKVAEHYQKSEVTSCTITKDYKTGLPVGTFSCSCGFVYSRRGPDKSTVDKFRIGRIKVFGLVWEQKLIELSKTALSLRKKAKILGVDPMTVKRNLEKHRNCEEVVDFQESFKRKDYRAKWLKMLQEQPNKSITEMRKVNPQLFTWLYRNDQEWLKYNYPITKKDRINPINRVDWVARDQKTAAEVKRIANEILAETNKLIRVSKNEIGRRIGNLSSLYNYLEKMPETEKALKEVVESTEQFQIRRIKFVARCLRKTKSSIKEWELVRATGLKKKFANTLEKIIEQEASVSD